MSSLPAKTTLPEGIEYVFDIIGLSQLLTHNPAGMLQRKGRGGEIPTPEVEAEAGCYRDEGGNLCIPGLGFRNAIITAAGAYTRGRVRQRVAHIVVKEELLPLFADDPQDGEVLTQYAIDVRRAVVKGRGGGAVARARPKFWPWGVRLTIIAESEMIAGERTADLLYRLLDDAGSRIGVGDYRPEKTGWFGRFKVLRQVK